MSNHFGRCDGDNLVYKASLILIGRPPEFSNIGQIIHQSSRGILFYIRLKEQDLVLEYIPQLSQANTSSIWRCQHFWT